MEIETFQYTQGRGWSPEPRADLDSDHTVVLVFGSTDCYDNPEPLRQLLGRFSAARVIGCSTSGEIYGGAVYDHSLSGAVLRIPGTEVRTAGAPINGVEHSYQAGVSIAQQLRREDLKGVIVLSDGQDGAHQPGRQRRGAEPDLRR